MNILTATTGAVDLVNISIANAGVVALLGYGVVFFGLVLLMCVITILGKSVQAAEAKAKAAAPAAAPVRGPKVVEQQQYTQREYVHTEDAMDAMMKKWQEENGDA